MEVIDQSYIPVGLFPLYAKMCGSGVGVDDLKKRKVPCLYPSYFTDRTIPVPSLSEAILSTPAN